MTTTRSGVTLMLALGVFRVAALSAQTEQAGRGAPRSDDGGERTASAARILADIKYLADDAREGRGVGTAGLDPGVSQRLGIPILDPALARGDALAYLRQIGFPLSQAFIEATLASHADIARDLVGLFKLRFDPAESPGVGVRTAEQVRGIEAAAAWSRLAR